jgi:hypothetical protein
MTKDIILVESLCLFLPIAGGKLPVVEGFSHSLGQCIVGREHLDINIISDFFIGENPHYCKEFSSSLLPNIPCGYTTPTNERRHKPQQLATPHPLNELRHNPTKELRHTPPMSFSTNPNNELRHIPQ